MGQSTRSNLIQISTINPRDFAEDAHKTVDDKAFGGSDGMVAKFQPWSKAIDSTRPSRVVFLSPQGQKWTQTFAQELKSEPHLTLVCGRYAGFDQRLVEVYADEEISVGDYILNGGEVAALAVMETLARLVPGFLGNEISAEKESFQNGLLEAPAFTRPREIAELPVPSPLLSGNHREIAQFEKDVSLVRTKMLRPELINASLEADFTLAVMRLQRLPQKELESLGIRDFEDFR